MAHYARINSENIVTEVVVVLNELITDDNGIEHEEWAYDLLYELVPDSVGDRWIKTSYNNDIRNRYAGIGHTYNEQFDAFIPVKPYSSWVLNEETLDWESPVPTPENMIGKPHYWNEDTLTWELVVLPEKID